MSSPFSALPLAGEPLTEQSRADLKRLALRTELDDNLALHFASVVPFYRLPDCVREFRLMLPEGVRVVEIRFEETTVTPIADLLERVPPECLQTPEHPRLTPDDRWVVCVFGLDESLDANTNPDAEAALFQLNVQRDRLLQLRAPLVFWLREDTLDRIATRIPDFWSWAGRTIRIRETGTPASPGSALQAGPTWRLAALPEAAKRVRLAALESFVRHESEGVPSRQELLGRVAALIELGQLECSRGELDAAEYWFRSALDDIRSRQALDEAEFRALSAIAWSGIADILCRRGLLDEALEIRRREELDVIRALGVRDAIPVALGKIADLMVLQGSHTEALRILTEEVLPALDPQDGRSWAIYQVQRADILTRDGRLSDALNILIHEVIPVLQREKDARSLALVHGRVGEIQFLRGELDAALQSRRGEELPVLRELGDVVAAAISQVKIAEILTVQGHLSDARRLLDEEALPVFRARRMTADVARVLCRKAKTYLLEGNAGAALDLLAEAHAAAATTQDQALRKEVRRLDDVARRKLLPSGATNSNRPGPAQAASSGI